MMVYRLVNEVICSVLSILALCTLWQRASSTQDETIELANATNHRVGNVLGEDKRFGSDATNAVHLFIAIPSAPKNSERRARVQEWLHPLASAKTMKIAYRFFTDGELPETSPETYVILPEAIRYHPDNWMRFLTRRLLFELQWGSRHFDFRWLLRTDDDVFFCVSNFIPMLQGLTSDEPKMIFVRIEPWKGNDYDRECPEAHTDNAGRAFHPIQCWPDLNILDEFWLMLSHQMVSATLAKMASASSCEPEDLEFPSQYLNRLLHSTSLYADEDEIGDQHCSSLPYPPRTTMAMNIGIWPKIEERDGRMRMEPQEWGRSLWIADDGQTKETFESMCLQHDLLVIHHQHHSTSIHRDYQREEI